MIRDLPRVLPAAPGKPLRPEARDTQRFAAALASAPASWTSDDARAMAARFDEMAESWEGERGSYRRTPLEDALARGGPWPRGVCIEVGAGTGLVTRLLLGVWERVACFDLSAGMLRRSSHPWRVRADASSLPVRDGVAAAVVIADAPLFALEVVRVLGPGGVVVWSNALGDGAPFHVPTRTLLEALWRASGHDWDAVQSEAGWGSWAVLRSTDAS